MYYECFFLLFDYFFCEKYYFCTKKGMKDIFHENKAEQPPVDGASAEALAGGQVRGRPTFGRRVCFFLRVQRLLQVQAFVCGSQRMQTGVVNKVMIYRPLPFYLNPSLGLWHSLWEQEIIPFASCAPRYQHVNIQYRHMELKINF